MGSRPEKLNVKRKIVRSKVAVITMDTHLSSAAERARVSLIKDIPGLDMEMHAASEYCSDKDKLDECIAAIKESDLIIVSMLFVEDHFNPIIKFLE